LDSSKRRKAKTKLLSLSKLVASTKMSSTF
jgi:hypothetical protein